MAGKKGGGFVPEPRAGMTTTLGPFTKGPKGREAYGREKAYLERYLDAYELRHPGIRVVRMRTSLIFKRSSASEQRRIFAGRSRRFPGRALRV